MTVAPIVQLDKKLSAALEGGRGIGLTNEQLDLLATLGVFEIVHRAKGEYLKEQARCRDMKRRSTDGANTGSDGTPNETGRSAARTSRSSGTTKPQNASVALQRAKRTRKRA